MDGRSDVLTVTWLPKFLASIGYNFYLPMVLPEPRTTQWREKITRINSNNPGKRKMLWFLLTPAPLYWLFTEIYGDQYGEGWVKRLGKKNMKVYSLFSAVSTTTDFQFRCNFFGRTFTWYYRVKKVRAWRLRRHTFSLAVCSPYPWFTSSDTKTNSLFFETLNLAFRTLQDMLLACRVFSSSQKAVNEDS